MVIVASAMPREFGVRELRISQVTYSLRVGLGGSSAGTTTSFGHLRTPSH
ncbi:hypothetical protein [Vulcanisaeta distributa]|nr:hypothetical protein [Vulcanisaeta distributa]